MVRLTAKLVIVCLFGLLLNGCSSGMSPALNSTSKSDKAQINVQRLRINMPQRVHGTIQRIAVYHPTQSQLLELSGSMQNGVRLGMEQIAFELRRYIPQLDVVERDQLDAAIRELRTQVSGLVRDEDLVRLGQMLGADHLLLYEIAISTEKELEDIKVNGGIVRAIVSGRIIRIETGTLVYRETVVQSVTVQRPPVGRYWQSLPKIREGVLWSALKGLGISLVAAFEPKLSDGILLDTHYEGPGARIEIVLINSPADKAGIRNGDLIIKVDGVPVKDRQDLSRQFTNDFSVTVRRDTEEKEYVVHVDRQ